MHLDGLNIAGLFLNILGFIFLYLGFQTEKTHVISVGKKPIIVLKHEDPSMRVMGWIFVIGGFVLQFIHDLI